MSVRQIRLRGAIGKTRYEMYNGAQHLVVPVVALVEGVIWPVNAEGPELVLAEELAIAPAGWNGRPVFVDHPDLEGEKISGNDPKILEERAFGIVFNAASRQEVLDTKRLTYEAWMNVERAQVVEGAQDILARCEAADPNDVVEISVGAYTRTEEASGTFNGKEYVGIWRNIVPDHHAMLPKGVTGACSVAMGCGAPRQASVHLVTAQGLELITMPQSAVKKEDDKRSLRERLVDLARFKFRSNAGENGAMSDSELRSLLDSALRAVEPGFWGVDSVFPDQSLVVYACYPEDTFILYQRSYTLNNNVAALNDDRVEVNPTVVYEPVTATSAKPTAEVPTTASAEKPCGCTSSGGSSSMNKAERIARLITNSNGRFTDADKTWLETVPEERLGSLEQAAAAPVAAPVAPVAAPVVAAAAKPATADEFLATLPNEVAEPIREGMRMAASKKAATIKALKDSGRCKFGDDALNAKSQSELDMLMELAGVSTSPQAIDFGVQGGRSASASSQGEEKVPEPPDMYAAIKAARSARVRE